MTTYHDPTAEMQDDGSFCATGTELPERILQNGFKRINRCNAVAADDALHKAWTKASRQFDASKGKLSHLFAAILTKKLASARRSEMRYQNRFVPFPEDMDFADEAAEIALERMLTHLDRRVLRNALARGLRHLQKRDRKLLWLSFWKELTYSQIIQRPEYRQAGLTVSACKCRASRAYAKLRLFLKEFSPQDR